MRASIAIMMVLVAGCAGPGATSQDGQQADTPIDRMPTDAPPTGAAVDGRGGAGSPEPDASEQGRFTKVVDVPVRIRQDVDCVAKYCLNYRTYAWKLPRNASTYALDVRLSGEVDGPVRWTLGCTHAPGCDAPVAVAEGALPLHVEVATDLPAGARLTSYAEQLSGDPLADDSAKVFGTSHHADVELVRIAVPVQGTHEMGPCPLLVECSSFPAQTAIHTGLLVIDAVDINFTWDDGLKDDMQAWLECGTFSDPCDPVVVVGEPELRMRADRLAWEWETMSLRISLHVIYMGLGFDPEDRVAHYEGTVWGYTAAQ